MDTQKLKNLLFAVYQDLDSDIRTCDWFEDFVKFFDEVYPDTDLDSSVLCFCVEKQGGSDDFDIYIKKAHSFIKAAHINSMSPADIDYLYDALSNTDLLDIPTPYTKNISKQDSVTHMLISRVCYMVYNDMPF